MLDRYGRLSLFRLALVGAFAGAVLLIGGVVSLNADANSRRLPLVIEPYPNAALWGEIMQDTPTHAQFYMRAQNATPEQVLAYYQQKLTQFAADARCVRTPGQGELPIDPNVPNSVPYRYDCLFDRSGRSATQYTRVTIFPETPAMDPYTDFINSTMISYQQVWQP